ncbi:MAG: hypothetical protein ABSA97_13925 [Verrucomicrobiia bacterium]
MEHELSLRGVFKPHSREFERGELAHVKEVYDAASVHAVPCQAVGMPRENSRRFSRFDSFQHRIEHGPAHRLGGLLLNQFGDDREVLARGKFAQFGKLRFNGENLFVLHVGRFSGV